VWTRIALCAKFIVSEYSCQARAYDGSRPYLQWPPRYVAPAPAGFRDGLFSMNCDLWDDAGLSTVLSWVLDRYGVEVSD